MLAALGRFCHRHHRWIVAAWLLLVVVGFALGSRVFDRLADTEYAVPGSESVHGQHLRDDVAGTGEQVVVLVDGHDVDDPALRDAVLDAVGDIRSEDHVLSAVDWYSTQAPSLRSDDGNASLVLVEVDQDVSDTTAERVHSDITDRMRQVGDDAPGATIHVGGAKAVFTDLSAQIEHDIRRGETIALPVTLVLLVIIFGGLVAALMPLAGAVSAIAVSLLTLLGFTYLTDIDSNAISITTIMGLGLSIDYALLVVSRYREERAQGYEGDDAAARTIAAAGRTVCFSALTVAAALSGLFAFKTKVFHALSLAGISVILVAALAALTLMPALLGIAGRRVRIPKRPPSDRGFFASVAGGTQKVAPLVAVVVAALLLLGGSPFLGAKFGGVDASSLPEDSESRTVVDAQQERFPGGSAEPVQVVARESPTAMARYANDIVAGLPHVDRTEVKDLGNGVAELDVYPSSVEGKSTEEVGEELVRDLRQERPDFDTSVTGSAALLVDMKKEVKERLPWFLGIIAVTTFVLLFLMSGSVLIPLKALVMDILSLGATFGMLVLVFQDGHLSGLLGFDPPGSLDLFAPIIIFSFAFGLSMDYEVFLLSRIKEVYDATGDNRHAVVLGLQRSGRIITSAALLIIVVCSGFVFGELVLMKEMGLAMAVAVAVDATLVRCLLVPATMSILGSANWWAPRWLYRLHRRFDLREHGPTVPSTAVSGPARRDDDTAPIPPVLVADANRVLRRDVATAAGRDVPVRLVLGSEDGPVLLFWPALGVPAGYYERFARALARHGVTVALPDLPGQGDSSVDPRSASIGYADVLQNDFAATVEAVREHLPGRRLLLGGNSIGGQLAVLYAAKHSRAVDGLVLVAAGTVYFGGFRGRRRLTVLGMSQLVGTVSRFSSHWPGDRLGFGGAQPSLLMRDWARNARTGRYVVDGVDFDPLIAGLKVPVFAASMEGDDLAPVGAMDHLCGKLRSARVDRWHHAPNGTSPGHLRWARDPDTIAQRIAEWITVTSR